jgi:hypothetical protein
VEYPDLTYEDIRNWGETFSLTVTTSVIEKVVMNDVLQRFLATPEGRVVTNKTIGIIRENVMSIVNNAISNDVDSMDRMKQAGLRINAAYDFIVGIANIVISAEGVKK